MAGLIAKFNLGRCCCPGVLVVDNHCENSDFIAKQGGKCYCHTLCGRWQNQLISCIFVLADVIAMVEGVKAT